MKVIVLLAFVALVAAEVEYYKTGNDHLNIEALVANRVELKAYLDCFNDVGPCTELTTSYKKNIPEAIQQACRRCNANQKYMFWRFLQGVKEAFPEEYLTFRRHYDPEDKYFDALEKEISKFTKFADK
ncbi:unnamed protein product, partial [Brenthis ino]